jgi:hypothetical protein
VLFLSGLALSVLATVLYVRVALARLRGPVSAA